MINSNRLVYDLPVRLFHWSFSTAFAAAFLLAKTLDDENPLFPYHMLLGLLMSSMVILRIIWGFVGPKHARFSEMPLRPMELINYFKGIISGSKKKWSGHNPASSWAMVLMIVLTLGLGISGLQQVTGGAEIFEEIHELLAHGLLAVVLMHIAGIGLHLFRHRDRIFLSMLNGKKMDVSEVESIPSARPLTALVFLLLISTLTFALVKNYDSEKKTLNLLGKTLTLGEEELEEMEKEFRENENH
jgi:cytochrome b